MLDQMFLMILPIILMTLGLAFDNTVFAFFGGVAAIFVGLSLLDTMWVAMIYIGLGIYFILVAIFAEWEE
ncbi:hypothetical protein ES703_96412 [subsurface metagenome]